MKIRFVIQEDLPSLPAGVELRPTFESWADPAGQEHGFGFADGQRYWMHFHALGSYIAYAESSEVVGHPYPGVNRDWFQQFFFHFVVPLVLQRQEWDCLHGSAVATSGGVAALCGPSGRGKSTLARAWCERGAAPHSDDCVPFVVRGGRVLSARLPQRPRLRGAAASQFPLQPPANGPIPSEVTLDLEAGLRPLARVYWLEPMSQAEGGAPPRVERIPGPEVFRLLLGEGHCMSVRDTAFERKMVGNYLRLAQLTPAYRLFFPAGLDRIRDVLDCLQRHELERFQNSSARAEVYAGS